MSEPTEPTPAIPPAEPPAEAPAADATPPPTPTGGAGAAPPPPPTTTWSSATPADPPPPPYAEAPPTPPTGATIGRNLAIGIAAAALVIGGLIGAVAANVLHDDGGRDNARFGSGRNGQQLPPGMQGDGPTGRYGSDGDDERFPDDDMQGGGQGRFGPRGVDPDGGGVSDDGEDDLAPSTPTTAPAVAGA